MNEDCIFELFDVDFIGSETVHVFFVCNEDRAKRDREKNITVL